MIVPDIAGEKVLDLGNPGESFVGKSTDPVILPQPYVGPTDFAAQYPTPLDPTEILTLCEELTVWSAIPELPTQLKEETYRELNSLAFTSGSSFISFADGECPEEFTHDGSNTTVTLKNIGVKKTLSTSDIMHSIAVAGSNWHGINRLVGGVPSSEGVPGGQSTATFALEDVRGVKEKETRLGMTLVLNGWDRLLVEGSVVGNALEFDGVELLVTVANGSHSNCDDADTQSGTFSSTSYDRFLAESCAKPTHVFGHPQAIQEMLSGYFQLGFQGSQVVNFADGNRITPGFNFAGFVNTGVGRMVVVSDNNFNRADAGGGNFIAQLFGLRMTHNGTPLVYKRTQIPLAFKDLVPGCTAVSFQIWAKTALVIKHKCAHSRFCALFTGNITTTCSAIG